MNKQISQEEIQKVKKYMMDYCCGYKNARPRQEIVEFLRMPDRQFRDICAEIPEIITSVHSGYWILPLVDATGEEIRAAREVLEGQDRRRVIALYVRMRRQRLVLRNLEGKIKQQEFAYV